ncbi:hypothetical protein HPP92_021236 [Vanilla planifolia]|uniref:Uncharacterized protein n=1 Tax=Vanilla planifolia TaxID=51239 RepID=A0A835UJ86_VANPL|nr:hypothetical protein HPP92_021236 [Vanilla planifolia]
MDRKTDLICETRPRKPRDLTKSSAASEASALFNLTPTKAESAPTKVAPAPPTATRQPGLWPEKQNLG